MANENTILTALGLDLSQFEKGTSRAVSMTRPLLGAIAELDTQLRKIPIIGDVYSATLGQIADGFAQTRLQARAFSQTMQTDVSGSLEGTLHQIEDINDQLKDLKEGSFGRSISDTISNVKTLTETLVTTTGATSLLSGAAEGVKVRFNSAIEAVKTGFKIAPSPVSNTANAIQAGLDAAGIQSEREKREKIIAQLEERKTQNVQNVIGLLQKESAARSAIVSGSELESEQARNYLEMRQKILNVVQQAQKIGGPDSAKWNAEIQKSVADQANLYVEIYNKQQTSASERRKQQSEELELAVNIAEAEAYKNERAIASLKVEQARLNLNHAQTIGIKEQIAIAQSEYEIAKAAEKQTQHRYDMSVDQLHIETRLMEAQITGQTRLARQLEIQARYQIQITEELRRGNTARAQELAQQGKLAQLQEAIRQYELGGRGRAAERAGERRGRRTARVVQSRLAERGLDQRIGDETGGGLSTGGLRAGGLTSGGLARPVRIQAPPPQIPLSETQQFMKTVVDALTK